MESKTSFELSGNKPVSVYSAHKSLLRKKNTTEIIIKMLFLTSELANEAEITILSAQDTTRTWVPGRWNMGRNVEVYKNG